jgi:hypothetical protein
MGPHLVVGARHVWVVIMREASHPSTRGDLASPRLDASGETRLPVDGDGNDGDGNDGDEIAAME